MNTIHNFINENLRRIFQEFLDDTSKLTHLCELKAFHYKFGNIPDYNKKIIQQLYLLRYLPLYILEYFNIYNHIITSSFFEDKDYRVISIGAGCGLDFYGLFWAINENNLSNSNYKYFGIDKYNWFYKDMIQSTDITMLIDDITKYSSFKDEYNICMLPKSIGEFNDYNFSLLKNIFRNSKIQQKKFILVSSGISSTIDFNTRRFNELCNILIDEGYITFDKMNQYYYLLPGFNVKQNYPQEMREFIKTLSQYCINKGSKVCDLSCKSIINKYPIYSSEYIKYNLVKFVKK